MPTASSSEPDRLVSGHTLRARSATAVTGTLYTPTEHLLLRFYWSWIEPLLIASRKQRCLARFGAAPQPDRQCASLDLMADWGGCVPVCQKIIEAHRDYAARYAFAPNGSAARTPPWRGTPLVIDLDRYPDYAGYFEQLKRPSKGSIPREIKRASRLGFYCRRFDRDRVKPDRFAIETSARYRSGGPVLAAFLRGRPLPEAEPAAADIGEAPDPPCLRHWYVDWGVFVDDANAHRPRLVGYLFLKRVGNVVRLTGLMGHAAYLKYGITKLLFSEAMRWLLDRDDPLVHGIRYLHGGAVEHGGGGLFAWKCRMQFEPCVFRWAC